jgi:four helix bundle protein
MAEVERFEDLVCWQLASELSDLVDSMTSSGAAARDFEFTRQIRKAGMKAPAQIAEAFMRWNAADTANFLRIARASLGETQSHLLKGRRRKYWPEDLFDKAWKLSDRTVGVTTGYMKERQRKAQREMAAPSPNPQPQPPPQPQPQPQPQAPPDASAPSPRSTLSPMPQPSAPSPEIRYHAPYMEWAKTRAAAECDLAGSNIMACSLDDLPGARDAVDLAGANDNGYRPLIDAIGARYRVNPDFVTTAGGTSGANLLVLAALLEPGDDVLVERPGYDPLLGAARLFGARTIRFDRVFDSGFALDPDRVRRAMTPQTKVIVITSPHNPTGVTADPAALDEIGRIAESGGAHVIVDEVYKDMTGDRTPPAAARGDVFVTTSSLTKSYGLSSLRAGWVIASPSLTYRVRRANDVVDGTGSIVAERLATLAFQHLDALTTRARAILARNKAFADRFLQSRKDLEWTPSSCTIVFPRIRGVADAGVFVDRLMRERKTAVGPGSFFDAPAHFRLGYGGSTEQIRSGLERIAAALDERAT